MNENPVASVRSYMIENQKEITKAWMKIGKILDKYELPTQLAAIASFVAETEFSRQGHPLVFDTILSFARHICEELKKENMSRN